MDERKSYFLEFLLSSMIGTAAGHTIAYYINSKKGWDVDRYIDKSIKFLEDVRDKSKGEKDGYNKNI